MNPRNIFFIVLALGGIGTGLDLTIVGLVSYRASRSSLEAQAASLPIGAASSDEANAKLEKAIKTMVARDEQVRKADLSVQADVTKNEVTLSGTVESEAVRSKAVELAKTAHVGVFVNDKMTVKPR